MLIEISSLFTKNCFIDWIARKTDFRGPDFANHFVLIVAFTSVLLAANVKMRCVISLKSAELTLISLYVSSSPSESMEYLQQRHSPP